MNSVDVLLIGGSPGAGKSTLGRAIASESGYASLTVDDLVIAARALTTADSHPELHLMPRGGHLSYFTDGPKEKLVADAVAQEEAMWPALEQIISSHISSKSPIVLDWWLLDPRRVAALADQRVASVWLYIDPMALWERERQNTDWMDGSSDPERMLANFMHRSLWRNDLVANQAEAAGLPVLHLTGEESVESLVNRVAAMIGDRPAP